MCALSVAPGSREGWGRPLTGSVLPDSHSPACWMDLVAWFSRWHLCTGQGRGTCTNDSLQLNRVQKPGGSQHNFIRFSEEGALGAAIF